MKQKRGLIVLSFFMFKIMKDEAWKTATWTDAKGRTILIHTMTERWLNNIRKMYNGKSRDKIQPIMAELKRRKLNRKRKKRER